jgi:exonuclease SbcD
VLDERKFNILLMHGDESTIDFSKYQNLPIDYVALGHYHSFSSQRFARGVLCRSGALITRGFDEIGDTGYIVLDICDDKINLNRGKIQDRRVISREIEVTHLSSSQELLAMFDKVFADATKDDYVNVVLTGKKDINIKTDILSIKEKDYFAFRLQDDTVIKVEVDELRRSQSVQGEFVRVLDSINADETIREMALELGLEALGLEEKL